MRRRLYALKTIGFVIVIGVCCVVAGVLALPFALVCGFDPSDDEDDDVRRTNRIRSVFGCESVSRN